MYVNYINDRKQLVYKAVKDTNCGIKLVLLTDSTVFLIRNFPSKVRGKTKKIIVVVWFAAVIGFSNPQPAEPIGLNVPPAAMERVLPSFEHPSELKIAKVIRRKTNRISQFSNKEILFLMYFTDPQVSSNQQVLNTIKELRGGSWGTVIFIGVIILILSLSQGAGFVPNNQNPGWGLDRPNPFQPPSAPHNFPPYYDFFFPRRTPSSTLTITRPTTMPHQEFVGLTK